MEETTHKSIEPEVTKLLETVVEGGYCIGCGACASISGSPMKIKLDEYARFQATIDPSAEQSFISSSVQSVCPFSNESLNEDQISQELYRKDCKYHEKIGYHLATYAGYVNEDDFRDRGSSGGMGTWIVSNLLSQGLVDGVIHVHQRPPSVDDPRLFQYQLSTTVEQVRNGSKSRYYPVEMSEVMQLIRDQPGRYAIVGIPCFIKAVRLLMRQDKLLGERIKFCVGLICGHLKSMRFAEMFAWQFGIEPGNLLAIDFRKKLPDADANCYGVEVTGLQDGQIITHVKSVRDLYGTDWGLGFFKYKACDYCDDVVAETADVTVGDAWLPQYVKDSKGTNVIVVRNSVIRDIIDCAVTIGQLKLDRVSADEVAQSQTSGLNHRREGLAYRLHLTDQQGEWRPRKRVQPRYDHLSRNVQERQLLRVALAAESHVAFKEAIDTSQFYFFKQRLDPLVQKYIKLYQRPLWKRVAGRIQGLLGKLLNT
ncbi:Coenzyme F420 hydrogenase/dehydrogenase, beta subunit C-terminal domain [Nostoc sp. UHCC 0302]|uniref:Coenzyme F420 hydrogenase/dehydrogenase, beta subunit C-terminal domain n=1 Tax=Nostoc sp. UHCC 0302 TaxID=3134896 RepID=UPI00311C9051